MMITSNSFMKKAYSCCPENMNKTVNSQRLPDRSITLYIPLSLRGWLKAAFAFKPNVKDQPVFSRGETHVICFRRYKMTTSLQSL